MKFTDEQRLIVMMLADIQKALKVKGEFNPDFIAKTAAWKDEFAIGFEYSMVFDGSDVPDEFNFVINVLDMWSFIERDYSKLTADEKAELEAQARHWGKEPSFDGFDGNHEGEYMGHTRLLVDDLNRFSEFKGRDFNSHSARVGKYAAMLRVFDPIRATLDHRKALGLAELVAILTARQSD